MIDTLPEPVVQIAAGKGHVLALDHKGTVYSWGINNFGQLAEDPKVSSIMTPREIKFFSGKNVVQMYAGDFTSCVVTKANIVYVWGCVLFSQFGLLTSDQNDEKRLADSPKAIISTPERVQIEINSEQEFSDKKRELISAEFVDTEKYFLESNKLEVDPQILMLEQRLIEKEKQIKLLMQ